MVQACAAPQATRCRPTRTDRLRPWKGVRAGERGASSQQRRTDPDPNPLSQSVLPERSPNGAVTVKVDTEKAMAATQKELAIRDLYRPDPATLEAAATS